MLVKLWEVTMLSEVHMHEELRKQLELKLTNPATEQNSIAYAGKQFLVFRVAEQALLVTVDDVREIIMPPPISFLPRAKKEIEGLIALRGEIMPVVNLRRLLGFQKGTLTSATRCLVMSANGAQFSIIVDEITEFVWLLDDEIDPAPQDYLSSEFRVVSGVTKGSGNVRPVVDVNLVLQSVFGEGQSDEQIAN
jgi:purine-binding chemotaxis protein CheW